MYFCNAFVRQTTSQCTTYCATSTLFIQNIRTSVPKGIANNIVVIYTYNRFGFLFCNSHRTIVSIFFRNLRLCLLH